MMPDTLALGFQEIETVAGDAFVLSIIPGPASIGLLVVAGLFGPGRSRSSGKKRTTGLSTTVWGVGGRRTGGSDRLPGRS